MTARLLSTATLLYSLSPSLCTADILLGCSATGESECWLDGPGEQDISFWLRANPGTSQSIAAIGFQFDDTSTAWEVLRPSAFAWIPEVMHDPSSWFIVSDLPDPQAVAFFNASAIPIPDGTGVEFARLTVDPIPFDGPIFLDTNLTLADGNVNPLAVKGGEPLTIFFPEPGSMSLLVVGTILVASRRRRT